MSETTKRGVYQPGRLNPPSEVADAARRSSQRSVGPHLERFDEWTSSVLAQGAELLVALVFALAIASGLFIASQPAKADTYVEVLVGGGGATGSDACGLAVRSSAQTYGVQPLFSGCSSAPASVVVSLMGYPVPPDGHNSENRNGIALWVSCSSGYVNVTHEGCASTAATAKICPCIFTLRPINTLTGNLVEDAVDYETAGPFPLKYERYYNNNGQPPFSIFSTTMLDASGSWRSNFEAQMYNPYAGATYPHALYFALPDGRQILFVDSTGMGAYVPGLISGSSSVVGGAGGGETVSLNTTTSLVTLTTTKGVNYVFALATGQLQTINFRGGYSQTLTYAGTSGPPSSVTDNLGRSLSFQYDVNNHLTTLTAGGTTVATYTYAANSQTLALLAPQYPSGVPAPIAQASGTLGSVTRTATGETTSYAYANAGNPYVPTSMTDARGIVYVTWTYNAQFQATSSVLAGPVEQTTLAYNPTAKTTTITNALSEQQIISYVVSAANNILMTQSQKQAIGSLPVATTTYAYDANDFLSQLTDAEGRVTTYVNDPTTGLPSSITRGAGTPGASTTTYTWNTQWRVPTQAVEPGRTTTYVWNSAGQLTSRTQTDTTTTTVPYPTNGETRTWTYAYGANNLVSSVTGPLAGEVVRYAYNATGFVKSVTDESGYVTNVTAWNSLGQPTSVTDPRGVVTALGYDGDGRLTSVSVDTTHTPSTTMIAYDGVGDVTGITDPIGNVQTFTYDGARRLMSIVNSAGETVTYVRDALGNATSVTVTNASSATTYSKTQNFDQIGRLIQSIGAVPANSTYSFGYDKTDNLTSVTDPRSYVFSYGFDALNRLIQTVDESSNAVNLTRDGVDAITAYEDPRTITTAYVRDGFSGIIQEASPDKGTWIYVRDGRGAVTQRTDPRGSVPSIADLPIADSSVFDNKGNLTNSSRTVSSTPAFASAYTYDLAGNIASIAYPSGRSVSFIRDILGRVTEIDTKQTPTSSSQTVASSIGWTPYSGVANLTFGNGVVETFTRDTDDRITGVVANTASSAAVLDRTLAWTGETLDSIADNQFPGNTPPFTYTAQSQSLTYTPTHRLASAVGYYGSYAWAYDPTGNRTSETANSVASAYAYPPTSNQLTSITPSGGTARSFGYDAAGDIATDSASVGGSGPAQTYQYDVEGRLAKTWQTATPADGSTYSYDSDSRLAQRIVTQTTTPTSTTILYAYDTGNHIIAELNSSGQTLREYIWLNDMPVAVVDNVNTTPVIYYVQVDHLQRPARMTDAGANWVWDVIFTPFGTTAYINQNPTVMNIRFPGQWFQLETGLAYNWHRHYDATTGRYVQPDPMQLAALLSDGPSVYGYVGQSPLARVDPFGEFDSKYLGRAAARAATTMVIGGGPEDPASDILAAIELAIGLGEAITAPNPPQPPEPQGPRGCDPCKGLRDQLTAHMAKLNDYMKDPYRYDNKELLGQGRDEKIISGRIANLQRQIENFRKLLEECEKLNGLR